MFKNCKNTKQQGNVGIGRAIGWLAEQGYCVSVPLTDSQDYDLIADINDKLCRIQVKTTEYKTPYGVYQVNLAVKGGNQSCNTIKRFDSKKVEYLFVLTIENDVYFIPTEKIISTHSLNLGKELKEYLQ